MNYGTLQGAMDFCDWSRTTLGPPFIDVNTGTVDNLVTYCTNSPCFTGVMEDVFDNVAFGPNPANEIVRLNGLPMGARLRVLDARGVVVGELSAVAGSAEMSVAGLPPGAYTVQFVHPQGRAFRTLLVVR